MNKTEQLVCAYRAIDSNEMGFLNATQRYFGINTDIFSRKNFNGHITGSAFVLNRDRTHALLVHHAKLQKWVQPGGHVEATDADVLLSAIREVREETGISELVPVSSRIFDIDAHEIPENGAKAEPKHFHFDVRFLLEAQTDKMVISSESTDIRWVPLKEIDSFKSESLKRMARKARIVIREIADYSDWSKVFTQTG